MDLKYFSRIVKGATLKKLSGVVNDVHKRTKRAKISIFFDMVNCFIRYGAGYKDYSIFEFYNMKPAERETYMTRLKNRKLISMLNDEKYSYIFDKKNVFDERYKKFLGRAVLDLDGATEGQVAEFVANKDAIFAKPYSGESGKGIEKLSVADFSDASELYRYLKDPEKNFGLIEEPIVQHEIASRIYPCAINCLRIVTLVWNGVPYIIYACFKMGNGGRFIDNLDNGGVACHFDLDRGEIIGRGHTQQLVCFDEHPYTGIKFVGYKLPFMDEIKSLVLAAAMVVPEIKYVGWDVCLTPDGPAIIEGNDFPGYDFPQLPDPDKPRVGLIGRIKKIIPDFKL